MVGFLDRSGAAFDDGFEDEAVRLATTVRVLLHDTGASTSLLTHLGVKDTLRFANTIPEWFAIAPGQNWVIPMCALAPIYFPPDGRPAAHRAWLDDAPARSFDAFAVWWDEAVTALGENQTFSRKDHVLALANKEGGAHVDPRLDAAWRTLTRDSSVRVVWRPESGAGQGIEVDGAARATMRQIAHEVVTTLRGQLFDLL